MISDRRLYLTEDGDEVCEEGDPRARFLLVGVGGTVSAAEVERLDLATEKGRVRYDGGPTVADLAKPPKGESRASKVAEEQKVLAFGGDKTGGAPPIDPPGEAGAEASAAVAGPGEDSAGADVADDSGQNDVEAVPKWTLKTSPAEYIEKWPDGKNADLARAVIAAQDDGADGDA